MLNSLQVTISVTRRSTQDAEVPDRMVCVLRLQPAVKPTEQDEEVLASVRSIVELVQDQGLLQSVDASSSAQLTQLIRQALPLLPELAPGLGYTGVLLDRQHDRGTVLHSVRRITFLA